MTSTKTTKTVNLDVRDASGHITTSERVEVTTTLTESSATVRVKGDRSSERTMSRDDWDKHYGWMSVEEGEQAIMLAKDYYER